MIQGAIVLLVSFVVAATTFAQSVPTSIPALPIGAEAEVRGAHTEFEDAWNRHDPAAMATMWTENADYTEPDGRTVFGRGEIQRLLTYEHKSVFKESRLHLAIERVRFIRTDTAITDGSYELFNAHDPTGKPIGTRTGYFSSVLVKEGRAWKVTASRLFLPVQLIWREK